MSYVHHFSVAEKQTLLRFFVQGGYVLDFSDSDFDRFFSGVLGRTIRVKDLSKGKSLEHSIYSSSDEEISFAVKELLNYYKCNFLMMNL
ncbi:hypothetical protein GCM10007377_11110 [Galliscardovia ingluviei]|uniref:Uncharacterized protein n=1 Tax=Galliscardovia ingluviei TaxID=1769422 RepID=A0A8J3AHF6_9BIFI|nr:hypothetical protein GCM10007377_11110 [Galliscardovia ingluviei]